MTGKELNKFFKEHLVPGKLYKIGGSHNKRICMKNEGEFWEVYFSDHKQKVGAMRYQDEESACWAMKNEVRKLMELMYGMTWAGVA